MKEVICKELLIESLADGLAREYGSWEGFWEARRHMRGIPDGKEKNDRGEFKKPPISDDEGITLYAYCNSPYFIDWGEIDTPITCLMFLHHLTEKTWIDEGMIRFIIEEASEKYNWGYLGNSNE